MASDVRAVYLMPSFQNPTGALMPEEARRQLARLIRATGVPLVEDDVHAGLALGRESPPPVAAYARDAPVITLGSLSKLFWGGLRVGWVRATPAAIAQLGRLKAVSDLGTSLLSQAVAVGLLADLERIAEIRRREVGERFAALTGQLERSLPEWRWSEPAGGLSLWVRLPEGSAGELAQVARRRGVAIVPGSVMSATGSFDDFVRLPLDHEPDVLEEGVRRLALGVEGLPAGAPRADPARRRRLSAAMSFAACGRFMRDEQSEAVVRPARGRRRNRPLAVVRRGGVARHTRRRPAGRDRARMPERQPVPLRGRRRALARRAAAPRAEQPGARAGSPARGLT